MCHRFRSENTRWSLQGKGLKKQWCGTNTRISKPFSKRKRPRSWSTLFRKNTEVSSIWTQTNYTACIKKHLKVDHPCRKHMYYLMVHDNTAFQFVETHMNQCWGLSHPGDTGEGILDGARSFPALPEINLPLPNALIYSWFLGLTQNHYGFLKTMKGPHLFYSKINSVYNLIWRGDICMVLNQNKVLDHDIHIR